MEPEVVCAHARQFLNLFIRYLLNSVQLAKINRKSLQKS